jgi:hypothetical protein
MENRDLNTGVSNAMHPTIFGQRGAFLSGRELIIPKSASVTTSPPMLPKNVGGHEKKKWHSTTDLCPHKTILAFPAPPPLPFATSRSTVSVVSQSTKFSTASFYVIVCDVTLHDSDETGLTSSPLVCLFYAKVQSQEATIGQKRGPHRRGM